ncbi:MAG TPA: DUF349 domain-containing protein [Acidothermaceae bacterium]|jgi:hypothetical protein|nr:DUF349 domain-containing protein [Acidothermaceae bacterium]
MGTSTAWGRIADDGTVYVRTSDEGERVVGSWQAGTPEEGLAHFVRRYDDLATEVNLLETRLGSGAASASSTVVAVTKLRASLPTANAVGDLTALDERLCTLLAAAEAKRGAERAAKAEAATKAVDAKKALADEAEKLAQSTQWKPAGDRLRAIVDEWKEIKGVERKLDTELWKRVSAARAEFGRRRGAHFATLDEQRKEAVAHKEKLVAEAETLAQSTDWTPTANRYKSLMVQWKSAPRASKDVDEALWQRFRAAQDTFFTRRTAALEEREAEFKGNQEAKVALLAEAEAIDPKADLAAAQAKLRDIQTRWTATGRPPREVAADFDRRLDAVADRIKAASEDRWRETSVSSSPLVIRLRESVEKLEKKIDRAKQSGTATDTSDLETQLATQREWLAQSERPAR